MIAIGIAHAAWMPDRRASLERLLEKLPADTYVQKSETPEHSWGWARRLWTWAAEQDEREGVEATVLLNDDLEICDDFPNVVAAMVREVPGEILSLHAQGPAALELCRAGQPWARAYQLTGPAYVFQRGHARALLRYWNTTPDLQNAAEINEDNVASQWAWANQKPMWLALPAPVKHIAAIRSTLGYDHHALRVTSVPWLEHPGVDLRDRARWRPRPSRDLTPWIENPWFRVGEMERRRRARVFPVARAEERLVILTPTRGSVTDDHAEKFGELVAQCVSRGIAVSRQRRSMPGLLIQARNALMGDVLGDPQPPTHYLCLDGDTYASPALVFEAMARPEDLIARAYPAREPSYEKLAERVSEGARGAELLRRAAARFNVALEFRDGRPSWSEDGRLVRAKHLGFGWVLLRAQALRDFLAWVTDAPKRDARAFFERTSGQDSETRVAELARLLSSYTPGESVDWAGRRLIHAFTPRAVGSDGRTAGEDVSFFSLWRQWGGVVWVDPWEPVGNGSQYGAYIDYMRETFGGSPHDLGLSLQRAPEPRHNGAARA
jgi:hypothetical protein